MHRLANISNKHSISNIELIAEGFMNSLRNVVAHMEPAGLYSYATLERMTIVFQYCQVYSDRYFMRFSIFITVDSNNSSIRHMMPFHITLHY